jgi:hypothetical protein
MRFPVQSTLPGLISVTVKIVADGRGCFTDKSGSIWQIEGSGSFGGNDAFLTALVGDGSMCSFHPFPDYPAFWMASGLVVNTHRQGFASAMYVFAREVLAAHGKRIAPSETVMKDGVSLWTYLDPDVKWEWLSAQGCWRPDLSGLQAP